MSGTAGGATAPAPTPATHAPTPATALAPTTPAEAPAEAPATGGTAAGLDLPRRLGRWQGLAVAVCLLFGLLAGGQVLSGWSANERAADNAAQLTRVQAIWTDLFRADALATNAFLVGGLEPTEQRRAYDASLEAVSREIAAAADAQPADRAVLADLNAQVLRYAETVQQARANNRQGLPVGAQYLREASASLRADTLPLVRALADANRQRAEDELTVLSPVLIVLPGLIALGVLVLLNQLLARAFRRRVNVGLAIAVALLGVATLTAGGMAASVRSANEDLQAGRFTRAVAIADARTSANDARSNESLRLVARGSGQAFEDAWVAADDSTLRALRTAGDQRLDDAWSAYRESHAEIVALDDGGQYDEAVEAATERGEDSASARFAAFDSLAAVLGEETGARVADTLRSGGPQLLAVSVVVLLLGVGAAAAASWGIGRRRREFA